MLTLEQVRAGLQDRRLSAVSEATGLSYDTVWRVARGKAICVSYDTVRRLSAYLQGEAVDG